LKKVRWASGARYALLVLFVAGCSSTTTPAEVYLERLAGALNQAAPDFSAAQAKEPQLALFPQGDALLIRRADTKLGVANLLAVHRCELGSVVGGRNSGLGRVHTPSQRFLYDLELLAGLDACESVTERLQEVQRAREAELPISAFNALFAGEEWHDFVTPSVTPDRFAADPGGLTRALARLSRTLSLTLGDKALTATLEADLAELRFSRAFGQQRKSWRDQSLVLALATQMLNRAREENPGCRNGQPTEAGRIRRTVFEKYYAQGFQPQLAAQAQPDRGWLLQLRQLVEATLAGVRDTPEGQRVALWHAKVLGLEPDNEFGRWQKALAAHTAAWQWQLRACGLLPAPVTA